MASIANIESIPSPSKMCPSGRPPAFPLAWPQVLLGRLTEALIAWLEGRLHVSREKLVEHCAALWVAAAHVPATLKRA